MTPKSLLRRRRRSRRSPTSRDAAASSRVIARQVVSDAARDEEVKRVLLCTGKVYYDLVAARDEARRRRRRHRPPRAALPAAATTICWRRWRVYADGTPLVWVQEEPRNMGAWRLHAIARCRALLAGSFALVVRQPAACRRSPATGSHEARTSSSRRSLDALTRSANRDAVETMASDADACPRSASRSREATIGAWLKRAEGDAVAADEPLVELETDKVTVEVPSPGGGRARARSSARAARPWRSAK